MQEIGLVAFLELPQNSRLCWAESRSRQWEGEVIRGGAAGPKLLSVARVVTSRTRGRVQSGDTACGFSSWRAQARPGTHSQTACLTHKPRHGAGGRAALKSHYGSVGVKERDLVQAGLGWCFEREAQFGRGDATGAHAPPIDEEAAGERDRDLFRPARVGVAQFIPRPDDAAIVRLELE